MASMNVKALTFDVFGTVVDWRSSLIREGEALGKAKGLSVDWAKFADSWRGLYQPAMDEVRSGRRAWMKLDDLHRESLDKLLAQIVSELVTTRRRQRPLLVSGNRRVSCRVSKSEEPSESALPLFLRGAYGGG